MRLAPTWSAPRPRGLMVLWLLWLLAWGPGTLAASAMPYLELGERPGRVLRLSRLILGTDHLGKVPPEQTEAVLDEAVRLGINTFDTAPIYTDDIEIRLGAWLRRQPRRDLLVISKGGFPRDLGPGTYHSRLQGDRRRITASVLEEATGSRAKFDRPLDLYLMHRDDADFQDYQRVPRPQTPVQTILEALSAPQLTANFTLLGLSNWETPRVLEAVRLSRAHPELVRPVAHSPYFSLLEMSATTIHSGGVQVTHEEMRRPDFQAGVKLMTYSPLGGFSIVRPGWEAARQQALELKQQGDRYWGHTYDAIFHAANAARYQRAIAFTARFNQARHSAWTLDQLLNAYVLAHPRTDFLVIGPRTVEQLRRTVAALELATQLTPADLDELHGGR